MITMSDRKDSWELYKHELKSRNAAAGWGWDKVKKGLVTLHLKSRPLANITLSMTWLLNAFMWHVSIASLNYMCRII